MSTNEDKFQWIAITFTALGLLFSSYYDAQTVKASRIDSELSSYLQLNEQYNKLLFTLINNDSQVFKKVDDLSLENNKYLIYELFELFATVKTFEIHYQELEADVKFIWERRLEFLFSKPAIQYVWQRSYKYTHKIYKPEFIKYVDDLIATQNQIQ